MDPDVRSTERVPFFDFVVDFGSMVGNSEPEVGACWRPELIVGESGYVGVQRDECREVGQGLLTVVRGESCLPRVDPIIEVYGSRGMRQETEDQRCQREQAALA